MIERVTAFVQENMQAMEKAVTDSLRSNIPLVNQLISDTIKSGGKRIRPLFLSMTSVLVGYKGELIPRVGAIIEHIHTASLIHDDVVDDALFRRGRPSVNSVYGNQIAVLAGDYLYTNAFQMMLELENRDLADMLTKAAAAMSEGEILQLMKTGTADMTMEEYLHIIYCKTGALFAASCACSQILAEEDSDIFFEYGKNVGYAFQMQDDFLDYFGIQDETGKKPGTDLGEKKMTLPVILLFEAMDEVEQGAARQYFLSDDFDAEEKLPVFLDWFSQLNIREKCAQKVQFYIDEALSKLESYTLCDANYAKAYRGALVELTRSLNKRTF